MPIWSWVPMLAGCLLLAGIVGMFASALSKADGRWAQMPFWLDVSALGGVSVLVTTAMAPFRLPGQITAVLAGVPVDLFLLGSTLSRIKTMRWLGRAMIGVELAIVGLELLVGLSLFFGADPGFRVVLLLTSPAA